MYIRKNKGNKIVVVVVFVRPLPKGVFTRYIYTGKPEEKHRLVWCRESKVVRVKKPLKHS